MSQRDTDNPDGFVSHARTVRASGLLPSIIYRARDQGLERIDNCDEAERGQMRIDIAEAIYGELLQALREQRHPRYMINCKVGEDDVDFARRWLAWLRYRHEIEQWRLVPEHAAAEVLIEAGGGRLSIGTAPAVVELIASRPKDVERVTLAEAPDGWPGQILSWQGALQDIIGGRWNRSGGREREPGDDDDALELALGNGVQ